VTPLASSCEKHKERFGDVDVRRIEAFKLLTAPL
jgi:hypothetical protein